MTRRAIVWAIAAVLGGWSLGTAADDGNTPSIKDVMSKLHKGANAPLNRLKTELQSSEPNWATIQQQTKEFVTLGASLAKNEPPKGSKESWQKLAARYLNTAEVMDSAAQKEDKAGAQKARNQLASSCAACHRAHKGR